MILLLIIIQYYPNIYNRVGVNSNGSQFKKYYGDVKLIPIYFTKDNFKNVYPDANVKMVL